MKSGKRQSRQKQAVKAAATEKNAVISKTTTAATSKQ
jgi:hypothetical protein